jgi:uncharacterized membrane protein
MYEPLILLFILLLITFIFWSGKIYTNELENDAVFERLNSFPAYLTTIFKLNSAYEKYVIVLKSLTQNSEIGE